MSDPRVMGVLRAGPHAGRFLARSIRRSAGAGDDDSIVRVRPTPALALQAYLDEVLIAMFHHPDLVPSADDYRRGGRSGEHPGAFLGRVGGSTIRPATTRTPRHPRTYGRGTHTRLASATNTSRSPAAGSRTPTKPVGTGG